MGSNPIWNSDFLPSSMLFLLCLISFLLTLEVYEKKKVNTEMLP